LKGKIMQFQTHNDANIETHGSSLMGYIQATRAQLEAVFGAPMDFDCGVPEDNDKVTTMWRLRFGTQVATIYDWKRYEDGAPKAHEVIAWHIGALDKQAELLVHDAFRERSGLRIRSAA
jgi:hypothetical protein